MTHKTLIQHVYECAEQSDARQIIIAIDDERLERMQIFFHHAMYDLGQAHLWD